LLPLHPESCKGLPEDVARMKEILEKDPDSIHRLQDIHSAEDELKIYPLHQACQQLHLNCVKFLIKSGAKVDFESSDVNNAIHYTIFGHNYDKNNPKIYQIVEELLKNKLPNTNIYKLESLYQTDFIELIKLNLNYIIKLFLEYNEYFENMLPENDFPKLYETSFSPITFALLEKNFECAKILIMHGIKMNNYTRQSNQFLGMPTAILKKHKDYENALRALKIFYSFKGNLWTNHMHRDRIPRNAVEFLRDYPSTKEHYEGLDVILEEMMSNPLSLKDQARLSLWKFGGKNYWKMVKSIDDVPKELKDYLNLEEL
jgi:hypothetical protein